MSVCVWLICGNTVLLKVLDSMRSQTFLNFVRHQQSAVGYDSSVSLVILRRVLSLIPASGLFLHGLQSRTKE